MFTKKIEMKTTYALLKEIENHIPLYKLENSFISNTNVGWQIEHILLTIDQIVNGIQKSNPNDYKPIFSIWKTIVFTTKHIPRGKAKAPKAVLPTSFTENSLKEHWNLTLANLNQLEKINKNQFIEHPYFAHLNQKETEKFLYIHTLHHLKIIKDLIKKNNILWQQ